MSRERHLPPPHTHAEGGEKGLRQARVGAAGIGACGASGRLMGAPYERMGDAQQVLRSGDVDDEAHAGDIHLASAHERNSSKHSGDQHLQEAGGTRGNMEGAGELAVSPFWQSGASRHGQGGRGNGLQ